MTVLSDETTHKRVIRVKISHLRLEQLLMEEAAKTSGLDQVPDDWSIKIEQLTAGSPAYSIQKWDGYVTLGVNLSKE